MYTPAEIGFWDLPSITKLARALKNDLAGGWWLRCLELWILHADGRGRLPKEWDAEALAAKARYPGSARAFVVALQSAKLLTRKHGRYALPDWSSHPAGRYSEKKEHDRRRQELKRKRELEEARRGEKSAGTSPVTSNGRHADESVTSESKAGRTSPDGPPDAPPGGGAEGKARWDWLRQHAERPRNGPICVRYLAAMSADDWALVQWVQLRRKRQPPIHTRKKRVWGLATDKFLREQAYLEFSPEFRAELKKVAEGVAAAANGAAPPVEKPHDPDSFTLAVLADPDVDEAAKAREKERWIKQNKGRTPPWEVA
ncbi:MAG TPA: hypothetical protein VN646_16930 [Candidatus Acidoferrum sp.]|nr:hypothetical protein [Candidatus Acidoferrum sp.]